MEQELKDLRQFLEENMVTKTDIAGLQSDVAGLKFQTNDLQSQITDIRSNMATKSELQEVKEIVLRIDRRTDEDIRAVMKEVEQLRTR